MNLILGDNIEKLKELDDNSLDSVVTDPPYGLSFMNKKWDHDVPSVEFWKEVLRVLKPGGYVLSFGGTRTYHRMAVAIEDAGFEIRDQIMWLYGSGFPKSYNISKGIDKKLGVEPTITGVSENDRPKSQVKGGKAFDRGLDKGQKHETLYKTKPTSDLAKQWDGYGTALKPANEPIVMARKPLSEKTIVDNVLKWGVGCINIDECRVGTGEDRTSGGIRKKQHEKNSDTFQTGMNQKERPTGGRFPANIILDEEAGQVLDEQSGILKSGEIKKGQPQGSNFQQSHNRKAQYSIGSNSGGASRFFYCAKASKKERNAGLEGMEEKPMNTYNFSEDGSFTKNSTSKNGEQKRIPRQNHHPTVKPIKLMEYLIKLVTPTGGKVLDPFMGSGSTGIAAKNLGFDFVGMELSEEYFEIAKRRINESNTRV